MPEIVQQDSKSIITLKKMAIFLLTIKSLGIQCFHKCLKILKKLLPLLSFVIPMIMIYAIDPGSFMVTYPGRTFYLFFLWLISLEFILNWERLENKTGKLKSLRAIFLVISLLSPTIYVAAYVTVASYYGLGAIISISTVSAPLARLAYLMLSVEYLVFAMLFVLIILLMYGVNGIKNFSVSASFLVIIGFIYIIDYLYPFGTFTPFQSLVLPTTNLASNVLNLMGFQTRISVITDPTYGTMPILSVWDPRHPSNVAGFGIAWPCAGIESLIIYTVTILLFLKRMGAPWWQKTIYFVVGVIITYFINILRIVTIFIIALNHGNVWEFHNYYGWLYSAIWIMSYPLIIIGSRALWRRIGHTKSLTQDIKEQNM